MVYGGGGGGGSSLKSYEEITAMTKANALTELNSHSVDYYTKFIDEEKMIADKYLSTETNASVFLWSGYYIQYSSGTRSDVQVGDAETTILWVMMADGNGDLWIPHDVSYSFSVNVRYDGGAQTHYTGSATSYELEVKIGENLGAYTKHLVEIVPYATPGYGWAKAFRFTSWSVNADILRIAPLLTGVVVDGGYKGWGSSATSTGDAFRRYQYGGCVNLEEIPLVEVLPSGVTSIGADFLHSQYSNCIKIKNIPATEVMPNTVTTIGANFRYRQYYGCYGISSASTEVLSTGVTTINASFREAQYAECRGLKTAAQEVLPSGITSVGNAFRRYQYSYCTPLRSAVAEVFPSTITSIGTYFRAYQYQYTGITAAPTEVLPGNITSIPENFRAYEYYCCTSLLTASPEVLPNTVTTVGNYFRGYQYRECVSLSGVYPEVMSSNVTSIGTYFRTYQYQDCKAITLPAQEAMGNITAIPNYFRYYQYQACRELTKAAEEILPSNVTSIGTSFRAYQYYNCYKLAEIPGWRDLSIGNTNSYRYYQFYGCNTNKTVTVLTDVGYAGNSNTLSNGYVTQINVPSAYLSNFTSTTKQPRASITDSKFVGY